MCRDTRANMGGVGQQPEPQPRVNRHRTGAKVLSCEAKAAAAYREGWLRSAAKTPGHALLCTAAQACSSKVPPALAPTAHLPNRQLCK